MVILKMPYRSERIQRQHISRTTAHKRERNRDYYVQGCDKVKARSRSLYDSGKKKAAVAVMYKLQPEKRMPLIKLIMLPIRRGGKSLTILPIRRKKR